MDQNHWTQIISAMIVGLPLIIAAIGNFVLSLKNSRKIDVNTQVTKDGQQEVKNKIDARANRIDSSLNGALDNKIKAVVKEEVAIIYKAFQDHTEQDNKNMQEILLALEQIKKGT